MPTELWKKGQSGNPAGRPKGARSVETLFRDAIAKIEKSMEGDDIDMERDLITTVFEKAKAGDMKAMEMYLDRLYGKPTQKVDSEVRFDTTLDSKRAELVDKLSNSLL